MKKIFYSFLIGITFFTACNSKSSGTEQVEKKSDDIVTEQVNKKNMATIAMTKADFLARVHNYENDLENWNYLGDKPALIDFYADWCGPCKQIAPILEELAEEYKDQIYIYKVNVDTEEELAALFRIRSIPTMLFVPMEGQPSMAAGAAPKEELKKTIESVLLANQNMKGA